MTVVRLWPLRHRVASTNAYIYSATLTWITAILAGVLTLLTAFDVMDSAYWKVAIASAKLLCLVTISVSYLAIRTRLNFRAPVMNGAHIRKNEQQQNAKLCRTLFIMITASLLFWVPSLVFFPIQYLCSECVPLLVHHIFTIMFRLANSLVNPIIYSFRTPIFRETFKRVMGLLLTIKHRVPSQRCLVTRQLLCLSQKYSSYIEANITVFGKFQKVFWKEL